MAALIVTTFKHIYFAAKVHYPVILKLRTAAITDTYITVPVRYQEVLIKIHIGPCLPPTSLVVFDDITAVIVEFVDGCRDDDGVPTSNSVNRSNGQRVLDWAYNAWPPSAGNEVKSMTRTNHLKGKELGDCFTTKQVSVATLLTTKQHSQAGQGAE